MSNAFTVLVDVAQQRKITNQQALLVSGQDWDISQISGYFDASSNTYVPDVWIEPITKRALLLPSCKHPQWTRSPVTVFSKYNLGDYTTLTQSGSFGASIKDSGGPFAEFGSGTTATSGNTAGITAVLPTQPVNGGMVIEWASPEQTNTDSTLFEGGWANSPSGVTGVSFRCYVSGRFEIWKAGSMVGVYSVHDKQDNKNLPKGPTTTQQPALAYNQLLMLPWCDTELLVSTAQGGGFCHNFDDLVPGLGGQTITDAAPFWLFWPPGTTPIFRVAQVKFASASGTVYGPPSAWQSPPTSGLTLNKQVYTPATTISGVTADVSVESPSLYNPFNVDSAISARLKITLGGLAAWSPVVFGARAWYEATVANTPASDFDLTAYLHEMQMVVQSMPGGTRATLVVNNAQELAAAGVPGIHEQCARPYRVSDQVGVVVSGIGGAPDFVDAFGITSSDLDKNQKVDIEVRDFWKLAEEHYFSEPIPLDGLTLAEAYTALCLAGGLSSYVSPVLGGSGGYTFPERSAQSHGEWGCVVHASDRLSEWLDRLNQTYASNCWHGVLRDGTVALIDPLDTAYMPTTSAVTLYRDPADAVAAGKSPRQVYRALKWKWLEPEANDVAVVGVDAFTHRPIRAHRQATESIDPTVAVASRSANWLGGVKNYGWCDPTLRDLESVNWALSRLFPKLTVKRRIAEFECDWLDGLWVNDVLTLDKALNFVPASGSTPSNGTALVVRIKSFDAQMVQIGSKMAVWRPARYVGEDISSGCVAPLGVGGNTVNIIARNWATKALSDAARWEKARFSTLRPTIFGQAS